jgi:hypothetical protein
MKKFGNELGIVRMLPLMLIVATIGIISYLLISSTAPAGGLFNLLNPKPQSKAAVSVPDNAIDMAYPCGFTNPAFCDNFSEGPATGANRGRGNDLDMRDWSFNRINPGGSALDRYNMVWDRIDQVEHCKDTLFNVSAPQDSFFCGSEVPEPEHWMEAAQVDGNIGYTYNDARIRQPFDFAGRTGKINFGVDAKQAGHGWWVETWITDQQAPGPDSQHMTTNDGNTAAPRNGIGIILNGDCGIDASQFPADFKKEGTGLAGVTDMLIVKDYVVVADLNSSPQNEVGFNNGCVKTKDDVQNMFQARMSTNRLELWGSDAGTNVMHLMYAANLNPVLPFSVGYVHFIHGTYNPDKAQNVEGGANMFQTYHWHDMGFDGPVHPKPRAYEILDPANPITTSVPTVDVGFLIRPDGSIWRSDNQTMSAFTFNNVNITGMTNGNLNLTVAGLYTPGKHIFYQFNNGPQRTFTFPSTINYVPAVMGFTLPVIVSDLVSGTNTLKVKTDADWYQGANTMVVANVELELNPNDSSSPAPSAPMISCNLMNLMMGVMPGMTMYNDPCNPNATAMPSMSPSMTGMPSPTPSKTPTPTPTPSPTSSTPPGVPNAPTVTVPSCIAPGYTGSGVTISWGSVSPAVSVVDLGADPNFVSFSNKGASGGLSVTAPAGFSNNLSLNPNTPYYTRIFNGVRSNTTTFTIPSCSTPTPTPSPVACPKKSLGDIDCDGVIGIFDYNAMVSNFGKTGSGIQGDLDGNGTVNIFDYNTLVGNFGK